MDIQMLVCPCWKPYWDEKRGATVIPLRLPPAPEAPAGYVVVTSGLPTYHRPYRYEVRWKDKLGGFTPSPHCSFKGFSKREWTLVIEAEAYANGLKACRRCVPKDLSRCEHCGRIL